MQEYIELNKITKEQHDEYELKRWLADSHKWVKRNNIVTCEWCDKITTTSLDQDAILCRQNPEIKKLLK